LELAVAHGERAPNLVSHLRQHGVRVQPVDYEDAQARAAIRSHAHKVILVIPPDYAERLAAAEPAPLLLYADSSDTLDQRERARVGDAINGYGQLIARLRLVVRGVDPLTLSPLAVQDVDVSTPASRSVVALGTLSYIVLLTMLMGGLYLSIDATAGERERGSLEPLLTVPVRREQLIYGKILAACAYMALSLVLTVTAFAILLRFVGLERFGMSVNFGPFAALCAILYSLPLVPLGAALMTTVAAFTRSYREAQTYLGLILIVPTLPLVFASMMGLRPSAWLMAVPSLSQHFLITALLRDEAVPAEHLALSMGVTLALGLLLAAAAGRLYHREALLG
jgi:sodium transport system permease protein